MVRRLPHAVRVLSPVEYNARHEAEKNVALFLATLHAEAIAGALRSAPAARVVIDQFTFAERLEEALRRAGVRLPVEIRPRAEDTPRSRRRRSSRAEFLLGLKELGQRARDRASQGGGPAGRGGGPPDFRGGGRGALAAVAKIHFKTTLKVTRDLFEGKRHAAASPFPRRCRRRGGRRGGRAGSRGARARTSARRGPTRARSRGSGSRRTARSGRSSSASCRTTRRSAARSAAHAGRKVQIELGRRPRPRSAPPSSMIASTTASRTIRSPPQARQGACPFRIRIGSRDLPPLRFDEVNWGDDERVTILAGATRKFRLTLEGMTSPLRRPALHEVSGRRRHSKPRRAVSKIRSRG